MANIVFNRGEINNLMRMVDNDNTNLLLELEKIRSCLSEMSFYWQTNGPAAKHLEELVRINQEVAGNYREFKMEFLDALEQIGVSYEESDNNIKTSISGLGADIIGGAVSGIVQPLVGTVKKQVDNTFDRYEQVKENTLSAKDKVVDGVKNIFDDPNDQLLSTHKKQSMAEKVIHTAKEMGTDVKSND